MREDDLRRIIRKEKEKRGLTLEALEALSGVSRSTIGNWVTGSRNMTLRTLILLLNALGLEIGVRRKKEP